MERSPRETRWQRAWSFIPSPPPSEPEAPQEAAPSASDVPGPFPGDQVTGRVYATEIEGVYIISVAARLLAMHPQTLRKYERVGLVAPNRTGGMLRLYSEEDIARLRLIKHLVDDQGMNLAGVELVLELVNRLLRLRREMGQAPDPSQSIELVIRHIDEMFALLNLSLPKEGQR